MSDLLIKEYKNRIDNKRLLETEIGSLPVGYISQKTIKGSTRYYLQHRQGRKVASIYIKNGDVAKVQAQITRRKEQVLELEKLITRISELEQAARIVNRTLYCSLLRYKLSAGMDDLHTERRSVCVSFGSAMTAIEGVPISNRTVEEIEKWKDGNKAFLVVFEDTLRRCGFPVEVGI